MQKNDWYFSNMKFPLLRTILIPEIRVVEVYNQQSEETFSADSLVNNLCLLENTWAPNYYACMITVIE